MQEQQHEGDLHTLTVTTQLQTDPTHSDTATIRAEMLDEIRRAAERGRKLVAFPEMATVGFSILNPPDPVLLEASLETTRLIVEAAQALNVTAVFGFLDRVVVDALCGRGVQSWCAARVRRSFAGER